MHYHPPEDTVKMYLPVLIEDPTRATAWSSASEDRLLAYSCVQRYSSVEASRRSIYEVFRKGDRVANTEMQLMDETQIMMHALNLSTSITNLQQSRSNHGSWRAYAASCAWAPGMTDHDWTNMLQAGPEVKSWSWRDIQYRARVEAVLYSLRIVQQILHSLISMNTPLPKEVLKLNQVLAALPPLNVLMARP